MRILHAYKIYRPDIEGGIPAVIGSLTQPLDPAGGGEFGDDTACDHSILCARRRGFARSYTVDGTPVEAVSSLGTLFSTPLAPAYIPTMIRRAQTADVVIHHAPLPLNDAAILLGAMEGAGVVPHHAVADSPFVAVGKRLAGGEIAQAVERQRAFQRVV